MKYLVYETDSGEYLTSEMLKPDLICEKGNVKRWVIVDAINSGIAIKIAKMLDEARWIRTDGYLTEGREMYE